jgi:hypothetical protein
MEEFVMSFLDMGPTIEAPRTRPSDFEMRGSWLHHFPSRHRFKVDPEGNVRIDARCDCAILHVRREQGRELWNAFQLWHSAYWGPIAINKEFSLHFGPPNVWQRLYRGLSVTLRRAFSHEEPEESSAPASSIAGTARVRERARQRRLSVDPLPFPSGRDR